MHKYLKILVILFSVLVLQACEKELVCDDDTFYIEADRCIKKPLNTVDFVMPEGMDPVDSIQLYEGFKVTLPEIESDFTYGWFTDDDFDTPFNASNGIIRKTTLYLNINGSYTYRIHTGTNAEDDNVVSTLPFYVMPEESDIPRVETEGYDFLGWYLDVERTIPYSTSAVVFDEESSIDIYASLEKKEYTVHFDVPEVMYPLEDVTVKYMDTIDKPLLDIERNYTWYTDDTYQEVYSFNDPITSNVTIYLELEDVNFYFAYHVGIAIVEYQEFDQITDITSHPEPVREGFDFTGWYVDKALTIPIENYEFVKDELHPVIHVYGNYEVTQYTLTYQINGEVFAYREYPQNDLIIQYAPTGSVQYNFSGWYKDPELTEPFTELWMPANDITVYGSMNMTIVEYDSLTALQINHNNEDIIRVTATVVGYTQNTVYVTDGTTTMTLNVYDRMFYSFPKGTSISLIGEVYTFNDNLEMNLIFSALKVGEDTELDWPSTAATIVDLLPIRNDIKLGTRYLLSGILQTNEQGDLTLFDGEYVIDLYTPMDPTSQALLNQYLGETITIDVFYIGLYTFDGELMDAVFGFDGTIADISVQDMSEVAYTIDFVVPDTMDSIDSISVLHGEYVSLPVIDTESRYGWFINDSYITEFDASYPIVKDITLYFSVLPDPITITYVIDGKIAEVIDYIPGEDLELFYPDWSSNERFNGWYTEIELTHEYNERYVPYEDLTLYASLELPNPVESFTSIEDYEDSRYTRYDYVEFIGIVTYSDHAITLITDGEQNIMVNLPPSNDPLRSGDFVVFHGYIETDYFYTIEAHEYWIITHDNPWPIQPIEMTFDEFISDGTSHEPMTMFTITGTIHAGDSAIEQPYFISEDTQTMMTFLGFGAQSEDIVTYLKTMDGQTVTVTLLYVGNNNSGTMEYQVLPIMLGKPENLEQITISYILDGELYSTRDYIPNDPITHPYVHTDPGFTFVGWYTDESLETFYSDYYAPLEDITLYGIIIPPEPNAIFTSLQDYIDSPYDESYSVGFEGIVTYVDGASAIITDGEDQLYVFMFDDTLNVAIGDKVLFYGNIDIPDDIYPRMDLYDYEVISQGHDNPLTPTVITYEDFVETGFESTDIYLDYYTFTGIVHASNDMTYYPHFGSEEDGTVMLLGTGAINLDHVMAELNELDGQTITITVIYLFAFDDYEETLTHVTLLISEDYIIEPETISISYVLNGEVVEEQTYEPGQLLAMYSPYVSEASTFDGWYTDETQETKFYGLYAPEEDLILYGTLENPVPLATFTSIQDFKDSGMTYNEYVGFKGIITYTSYGLGFITDGVDHVKFNYTSLNEQPVSGDEVILYGYVHVYENHSLIEPLFLDVVSHDNENPLTPTALTIEEFIALDYEGTEMMYHLFTLTAVLHAENDEISYLHIGSEAEGYLIHVHPEGPYDGTSLDYLDGQTVTITIIYQGRNSDFPIYYYALIVDIIEPS